jgi:outer membrane protein OmpA-like peptidoglycan-associated protein
MMQRVLRGLAVVGACLLATGCATKSFVQGEVQKSEQKVGQQLSQQDVRVGTVEATLHQEQERLNRVALNADQAHEKATQALAKAEATDSRLIRLWANRNKRELVETVVITFGFNKAELDDRGETSLVGVVKELQANPTLFVDLVGYTDVSGPAHYNVGLSQRRVEAVRRFLVNHGVDLPRIQAIGLGPVNPVGDNKTVEGRRQNRRVALMLFTQTE